MIPENKRNRHAEYIRENTEAIFDAIVTMNPNGFINENKCIGWERDVRGYITLFRLVFCPVNNWHIFCIGFRYLSL